MLILREEAKKKYIYTAFERSLARKESVCGSKNKMWMPEGLFIPTVLCGCDIYLYIMFYPEFRSHRCRSLVESLSRYLMLFIQSIR